MTTEYSHIFLQKSQKLGLLHDVLCLCQRTTSVPSSNPPISLFSPVPSISRRETKGMSFSPFKLCYINKSQMSESWPSRSQPINLHALLHRGPSCSQPGPHVWRFRFLKTVFPLISGFKKSDLPLPVVNPLPFSWWERILLKMWTHYETTHSVNPWDHADTWKCVAAC